MRLQLIAHKEDQRGVQNPNRRRPPPEQAPPSKLILVSRNLLPNGTCFPSKRTEARGRGTGSHRILYILVSGCETKEGKGGNTGGNGYLYVHSYMRRLSRGILAQL